MVYTGATTDTEIIPETSTGTILEDLTETGEIEILNTEILPETETNTGETEEEETTTPEEIVDLQGRLLYDKNGNMIGNLLNNKRQYIYSYDYKNRLAKIEKTIYKKVNGTETNEVEQITRIVQFRYDVLGRRIKRINNNLTYTKYYYGDQNLIQEEYYTKTNILKNQKNYVYGSQIDDVLTMENID
ncbi:hypothetical protein EOM39_07345, partial [Candidatus Gracilibacteria bacterium]|nr:hypothetical protein [Candidatus Gracilibacteria bacterium]